MPPLPSLPSAVSFLRGVAPRSQSAAGQLLPTARRGAPSAWYTHESRPFTFSDRSCSVSLRALSQSQSQAWNRCAGRLFSSSTRQAPSYQYKRFQPGRIPYPGQQGGGGGGGPPWWAIYRNELVIGVGIGGAFYLYNLETVEVSTGLNSLSLTTTSVVVDWKLLFAQTHPICAVLYMMFVAFVPLLMSAIAVGSIDDRQTPL